MSSISVANRGASSEFRPEIQGLRAIAVLLVLVYHAWPKLLPGGYVGVDAFFVISGYLITGLLFKEYSAYGSISLANFYARRVKRLLPAATLVLLVVAVCIPLLPEVRWEDTATGVGASALYMQNWWLAGQAVDYLAAEGAPSILKHYWSLSVEEQYYFAWPLMVIVAAFLMPSAVRRPKFIFRTLILGVIATSLIYSIWATSTNPGLAYFSTLTRAWELGLGGLLAVTTRWRKLPDVARDALGWLGVGLLLIAALRFEGNTAFPGYAALLPTLGAAAIIVAGTSNRAFSTYTLLRSRLFQYLGDISYSLYLWHWPVIVLYREISGREIGLLDGLIVIALSCALAHQTKELVEDYFRGSDRLSRPAWAPFAFAGLSIVLSITAAGIVISRHTPSEGQLAAEMVVSAPNPGAMALTDGIDVSMPLSELKPDPQNAREDWPTPYLDRCVARTSESQPKVCRYGDPDGKLTIALVGDTNAVQWQPALEIVAQENGWELAVISKINCAVGRVQTLVADGSTYSTCTSWNAELFEALADVRPNIVLFSQSPRISVDGARTRAERAQLLAQSLKEFASSVMSEQVRVGFIRSTPNLGRQCVDAVDFRACAGDRGTIMSGVDPVVLAAESLPGSLLLDFTDALCDRDSCPAVVGNIIVRRDTRHFTATFAQTLAPEFGRQIQRGLALENVKIPSPLAFTMERPISLVSSPMAARQDNPDVYQDGCHANQTTTEPMSCEYGVPASDFHIVLTGDSHAAQWLPPLQEIVKKHGWRLTTFTKSACTFSEAVVMRGGQEYSACTAWNQRVVDEILKLRPSVVVTSQSSAHRAFASKNADESLDLLANGLSQRWKLLSQSDIPVVAIRDTPWMEVDVPDCLSSARGGIEACTTSLEIAYRRPDSIPRAAERTPGVQLLDLNSHLCDETACSPAKDGMIVWRDRHHLTASYARSLAPYLEPSLIRAREVHSRER